jgi:hypothetical protein
MDNESYFTVDGNKWQQQSYYESEDNRGCQVYSQDQVPSVGFVVAGYQWKQHKRTSVF